MIDNEHKTASVDELFQITMIDRVRKCKVEICLKDKDGDEVPVRETIEKLTEYVLDKVKDTEGNQCKQQIMPLMGQAMVGGLSKILGLQMTALMLSQDHTRYSLMHMMTVGFYLLQWLKKKEIKIHTTETPLSDDDLAMYDRINSANSAATAAGFMGQDPREVIKSWLKAGKLSQSDLKEMGIDDEINITKDKHEAN
jgi:hypothetical protein